MTSTISSATRAADTGQPPRPATGARPARRGRAAANKPAGTAAKAVESVKPAKPVESAERVKSAKPTSAAKAPGASKSPKVPKPPKPPKLHRKPVRDSFTMPEADFALIATLKARALAGRRETKKSELLRAGLHALAALDTPALVKALSQLEPIKIGRPKKDR